ncbi:MAG: GcvT family protein [Pikeienuella sp.]
MTEVAIIGGGVMGISLAYHLSKAGVRDIVLLEKNDLTHGSTWHAAGLCTHFAHNATIQELRATSVRLYRDILPKEVGRTCGFHRSGAMRITRNPDRLDEFAHVTGLSKFTGYDLLLISPDEIAELHPLTHLDGLIGGIYEPDDGHVDPTLAVTAMAEIARSNGVEIRRYEPVRSIYREVDHWTVDTDKGQIKARHIVNAAGTWGFEVGQMMGVNVPSVPILHQYLVTDRIDAVADRKAELPIIRDPEESWYVRQERDGLILGPYEKEAQPWSIDQVPPEFGADLMPPDLDRVEHIIDAAMARIPALGEGGVKTVVNGPITFSPDGNPLIGPAFGQPNCWIMTGSSMGVMEGGGAGWFLAHWMTKGAPPMDALAIDPRRFGQWADRDFRISKAVECFGLQFGVHYPYEERPAARGLRKSPLHNHLAEHGAIFGVAYGWERPNYFGKPASLTFKRPFWQDAVLTEGQAASTDAVVSDMSILAKFDVIGTDLQAFLTALGPNKPPKVGRIGLTHSLTPTGGVSSEFTVTRITKQHAYLTSAAAAEERDFDHLRKLAQDFDILIKKRTDDISIIGIHGPNSMSILSALTDTDLNTKAFPWLSTQQITVAGEPLTALRVSYIGEPGWELHLPNAQAVTVFDAIIKQGAKPIGAYAMNALRLEKGYRAWGMDLTTERTLAETGLEKFGGEPSNSGWRMALLSIGGDCYPYGGHCIKSDGKASGIVTSAAKGPRTSQTLALAFLRDVPKDAPLVVEILGEDFEAKELEKPPYDPDNLRLRCQTG